MSTAHTNLGPGLPIVGQSSVLSAAVAGPRAKPTPPLPMTRGEMLARGWDEVDVVFVTGDAYVDHPSFANALLGRLLEHAGYRVAILSQPDWKSAAAFSWSPSLEYMCAARSRWPADSQSAAADVRSPLLS